MIRLPAIVATLVLSATPAFAAGSSLVIAASGQSIAHFDSESAAQERCPNDSVVWLNTNTGVYHYLSVRRYGRTHRGAYVCKTEADAAGNRAAQGKDR